MTRYCEGPRPSETEILVRKELQKQWEKFARCEWTQIETLSTNLRMLPNEPYQTGE